MNQKYILNHQLYPKRVWKQGFSRKPNWLLISLYMALAVIGLLILGNLANEAWYKHEQNLCLTFKYPSEYDKAYCKNFGVLYKPLR